MALKPPNTAAPSSAPTIHVTTGPAASTGPIPGMAKKAAPNSNPRGRPKKRRSCPVLHPVAGIVVTHHVFVQYGILAHDGQGTHVDSRALKFLNRFLRSDVSVIYSYHCV